MTTDIKAPAFPESVQDGTIAEWHVAEGGSVKRDMPLVDIETDKVVIEVVAPADGVLTSIIKASGDVVESNEVIGAFEAGAVAEVEAVASESVEEVDEAAPAPQAAPSAGTNAPSVNPAAKRLLEENDLTSDGIAGSGKSGRITKTDVVNHLDNLKNSGGSSPAPASPGAREEKRVPMSRLRARVAERLLEATQTTAMLTTFNEVDMTELKRMRAQYRDAFEARHEIRLGFMSFFVRACVEALKKFPAVNASIDGSDIVYHGYQDIGVAVSSDRGLVVPILREADAMSLADTEAKIREFGTKAMDGKLSIEDMTGGTFTISNGGVFGSLLSTPILNPPQTAILGMHTIQDRPVAINGEVVIRPMMYLALSYDHRLIDGKEAVQFLIAVKEVIEDPTRILLNL
ncbi:MAG: 2-oxoglutarate dehydrogenase complex dihydrolipoyllysine-residue succinyltransferase [Porticoccaceae bacterium]|jgi:2-oxoglutarate dehydrogenase E2 component (dihydrolipoamide succinyltransferase)|nr:2-oxoglutarate dehydrogenase complex dihydrolipoyllysine-residue succinyltransferase [Porticoccaceae bacterium]